MKHVHLRAALSLGVLAGFALAVSTLVATASADVTIEQKTATTGMMGFGNGTNLSTLVVAGDRSRNDEEFTYTGTLKTFAGGGKPRRSGTITRLDRELIWILDDQKKEYSELTFAQMKARTEEAAARAQAEMKKAEAKKQESDVEMEYKFDVQRTGKKDTVNGFAAEQVILTLTAVPKDKKSGAEAGTFTMKMDEWLSTAVPGQAEIRDYYRRMAEKLGIDLEAQRMGGAFMAQYGSAMKELSAKLKDLKGYPVRSTLSVLAGPQLTPEQQAEIAKQKEEAKKERAENQKQAAANDKAEEVQEGANAASEAKRGNMKGAVSGFLARRAEKAAEKKAQKKADEMTDQADAAGGDTGAAFTAVTDLLKVSTGPATVGFEPPANFKKVEDKPEKSKK